MLARWQFWVATVIAFVVALAAGYTMMVFGQNRSLQAELARRAQYLQETGQLEIVYREMVKGLADLSVRTQDRSLTDLLASQGITVTPSNPTAAAPASTDPKKGSKP